MKPLTAIAISGGIDSLTAAFLLKQQGHQLIGIHFLTGFEAHPDPATATHRQINRLADQLSIPIEVMDCKTAFKAHVVDYFIDSYRMGLTPNPCLVCNPLIKFGAVFDFARQLGATHLATGHYARRIADKTGRSHLYRGVDTQKDQSYFLARLTPEQLDGAIFPLGGMTKADTRTLARKEGLNPVSRDESQDVCFIHDHTYGDFLEQQGMPSKPGPIVDLQDNILGEHQGLHLFTIGQRRGINCPGPYPYYVVKIDTEHNRLIVGTQQALMTDRCRVEAINWIQPSPFKSIKVHTRVRYRHKAAASTLIPIDKQNAEIIFDVRQKALTPGQGAVFYTDDEVLGGGWIAR